MQSVKLLSKDEKCPGNSSSVGESNEGSSIGASGNVSSSTGTTNAGLNIVCAAVAFMDIKSAAKAHATEHILDERVITTEYYEPHTLPIP